MKLASVFLCFATLCAAANGRATNPVMQVEGGAPSNDLCSSALEIPCDGTLIDVDNTMATNSPGDPLFSCDAIPTFGNGTLWFRFTATGDSVRIISTHQSGLVDGGLISLLEGSCGAFTALRCSRPIRHFQTRLVASGLVPGQEYYIEIASALTSPLLGQRSMTVDCLDQPPPGNDNCSGSTLLTPGAETPVNSFGATSDSPSCMGTNLENDVWFSVFGTGNELEARAFSSEIENFTLSVFEGTCNQLECVTTSSTVFGIGFANWCSVAGRKYFIAYGSPDADEGVGGIFITPPTVIPCDPDPPPTCFTVGFEAEDDFATPLVDGQQISSELSGLFSITTSGPNAGAVIYSSQSNGPNGGAQDADLLVDTGNLLILQNDNAPVLLQQTVPGIYDFPNDDPDGGTVLFGFNPPVIPMSIQLVDVDNDGGFNTVVLTDTSLRFRTFVVPDDWTGDRSLAEPGMGTLNLNTLAPQVGFQAVATASEDPFFDESRVVSIEVSLVGSGAIDDLSWCQNGAQLVTASAVPRNGSNLNPEALSSWSKPTLGGTWVTGIDCSAHAAGSALLFVFLSPLGGFNTPFGELLVGGAGVFSLSKPHSSLPVFLTAPVPANLALLGREAYAQSLCTGSPGPALSNALDITLGF